jgi:uncharacterized protein
MKQNISAWFEIPVTDMTRAVKFYETVLGLKLQLQDLGELQMAWFPAVENAPGAPGTLVYHSKFYNPSADGVLIYLSSPSGNLSEDTRKVEEAGGKVLIPRRQVSENFGFMAVILDSEGNRIALRSGT